VIKFMNQLMTNSIYDSQRSCLDFLPSYRHLVLFHIMFSLTFILFSKHFGCFINILKLLLLFKNADTKSTCHNLSLCDTDKKLQTSFSHISINSSTILTVSIATESPWKNLSIDASYVLRQSILAKILGRSTSNHYSTIY